MNNVNWNRLVGFSLIAAASYKLIKSVVYYLSGRLEVWPLGISIISGVMIVAGVILVRKSGR